MHYIKTCPTCGNKIRFPIDKGKIKVTCQCDYSFIADPDDKSLYKNGNFDLSDDEKAAKKKNRISDKLTSAEIPNIKELIIKKLYDAKYTLQNFKLLPSAQQRKIIIRIIIISIILATAAYLISLLITPKPYPGMI